MSHQTTIDADGDRMSSVTGLTCPCGKPAEHVNAPEESADWACRVPLPSAPIKHRIEGWEAPKWATSHSLDEGSISWDRGTGITIGDATIGADEPIRRTYTPRLTRCDDIDLEPDTGHLSVNVGPTRIYVADDLYLSIEDARALAPVLLELADAAEAGR